MSPTKVEVEASQSLDRILFRAREPRHASSLRSLARGVASVNIDPLGFWVKPFEAIEFLGFQASEFSFSWNPLALQVVKNRKFILENYDDIKNKFDNLNLDTGRKNWKLSRTELSKLDSHQHRNVVLMTTNPGFGFCLFDEQGTGKTVSTIFAFDELAEKDLIDFALIVSPKSMIPEWQADFINFTSKLYSIDMIAGSNKEKKKVISGDADVLITNFETLVSMEDQLSSLAMKHNGRSLLVIDESFFIKNPDASRTQAAKRLREWFGRAFVLCGTPAPNSPQDLVEQISFVDFGFAFDGVDVPDDKEKSLPIVQEIINAKALFVRNLKKEVLPNLPSKTFQEYYVSMEANQLKLYTDALNSLATEIEQSTDEQFLLNISSYLAKRMALLQICSNPIGVSPAYEETPAKLNALDSILVSLISQRNEKVVIWSYFRNSINEIVKRYSEKYQAVRYDGTIVDIAARRNAVRRFQEDDSTMLFIGNPSAAGAGLTLHRSRFAIYESFSNQGAHYLQSLDRIHRRGQARDVEYLILLCEGTIEQNEYNALLEKETAGRQLLGDGSETKVSRKQFLFELYQSQKAIERK